MSFQASFKQILKEKMNEGTEPKSQTTLQGNSDPAHLAYLMGHTARLTPGPPTKTYPRPAVRPVRKPHHFNPAQTLSFNFMKSWVNSLNDNYSEMELKKAFRQAALILHPDKGGSTQLFWELKGHYEILQGLVKKS